MPLKQCDQYLVHLATKGNLHPVEVLHIHKSARASLLRFHGSYQLTPRLQDGLDRFVEVIDRESQVNTSDVGWCGLDVLIVGNQVLEEPFQWRYPSMKVLTSVSLAL